MTGLPEETTLDTRVRRMLGRHHPVAAAATVSPDGTALTTVGAPVDADFEIGSISKGITGLLYREAIAQGEIQPSTTLAELLPLRGTAVAGVTLASLSTHRSGLPSLPRSMAPLRRTVALWRHGTNPYGDDLPALLDQARTVTPGRPRARYSNFGFELLGHALASAAGTSYADLVRRRIADPLGLDCCYVPATPDDLLSGALIGRSRSGRIREPWTGEALGPAGGIRASIGDLARLTAALLGGSAPGIAALDPEASFGQGAWIGAGWITVDHRGLRITWHNGGTGGFRSWLGVDRLAGTGVVILSATSSSVDRHGFTLLRQLTGHR